MLQPAGVWVVAACFNEQAVITSFIERVLEVPGVERLVLVDDGSRDDTVSQIRGWQARQAQIDFPSRHYRDRQHLQFSQRYGTHTQPFPQQTYLAC